MDFFTWGRAMICVTLAALLSALQWKWGELFLNVKTWP